MQHMEHLIRRKWLDTALIYSCEHTPISLICFERILDLCAYVNDQHISARLGKIIFHLMNRVKSFSREGSLELHDLLAPGYLKARAFHYVIKKNNIDWVEQCMSGAENSRLLTEDYGELIHHAVFWGAGRVLAHLCKKPMTMTITMKQSCWAPRIFFHYFENRSGNSPVNRYSTQEHKEIIGQLLLRGAKINDQSEPAIEQVFKTNLRSSNKAELSDFLLNLGATLNDCNPRKSMQNLLTIAIQKRDLESVKYLVQKARAENGYDIEYMQEDNYNVACEKCLHEWQKTKRQNDSKTELLFFLVRYAKTLKPNFLERLLTSSKIREKPEVVEHLIKHHLEHLIKHHRTGMISYSTWDWSGVAESEIHEYLKKHFANEFAETVLLGVKPRLNQRSFLRFLNEDNFITIFKCLFG